MFPIWELGALEFIVVDVGVFLDTSAAHLEIFFRAPLLKETFVDLRTNAKRFSLSRFLRDFIEHMCVDYGQSSNFAEFFSKTRLIEEEGKKGIGKMEKWSGHGSSKYW